MKFVLSTTRFQEMKIIFMSALDFRTKQDLHALFAFSNVKHFVNCANSSLLSYGFQTQSPGSAGALLFHTLESPGVYFQIFTSNVPNEVATPLNMPDELNGMA